MSDGIYQHFSGYEQFVSQLRKAVERYRRYPIEIAFDYLTIDKQNIAESVLGNQIPHEFIGGYPNALKKRLVIGEDIDPKDYIICLKAHFNSKFNTITHRDVTGALYGLRIDIEKFGDLWVDGEDIYLYTEPQLAQSVCSDFTQISRCTVRFEMLDDYPGQTFEFSDFQITVSSMRLDVILGHIIRKSRSKAQEMIRNENVNVNFQTIEDCDYLCNNGDIVSVRGTGRFIIANTVAVTKSGNTVLLVRQFI
ncbi:MAG: hypothetical protein IJM15_07885 [Erysipelotrichaceae bacterium]|nr:hypothetical protein [Erysipelotrichaceae bacterium]